MENNTEQGRAERIVAEVTSYVNMRIDAFKLALVENLSMLSSNMLALMISGLLMFMALALFTFAIVYWLNLLVGSIIWAVVITGALYLIIAVIFFALRNKLLSDKMVRMFSNMFFTPRNKMHEDYEDDEFEE